MSKEKVIEQIHQLQKALEEIEKRLTETELPLAVLEDFKMAVDHTRMTVWALLSAPQGDQFEVAAAIVRFRVKRTIEMCRQIVLDIDTSELTIDSPELQQFQEVVKATLERIDRLYQSGS